MAIDLSAPSSSTPQKTNTVMITSLSPPWFHPHIQQALRSHFESFGTIHTWAPLRSFGRVIVVYWDEQAAEDAKALDGVVINHEDEEHTTLRVFRSLPTPLDTDSEDPNHHLAPPAVEKNFLISPPGSPPVGWQQVVEEPPNSTTLASDLLAALQRLQMNSGTGRTREDGREELVRAEEVDGGIGIWVEDVEKKDKEGEGEHRTGEGEGEDDEGEEGGWFQGGNREPWRMGMEMERPIGMSVGMAIRDTRTSLATVRTPRPPMTV